MKILFANSMKGIGGGERWLLDSASCLRARGHDVCVAARPGSPLLQRAQEIPLPVLAVAFRHDLDLDSVLVLRRHNRSFCPDVVVAQIQRAHRVAVWASFLGPRVPVVVRVGQRRAQKRGPLHRWTWGRTAMMLANCEAVHRDFVEERIVSPARARLLWSGLPEARGADRARARAEWKLAPGTCAVLCLARLVRHKDHATLLRAWSMLSASQPEAALLLAGDGPEEASLRRLAQDLGVTSSVRFLGHVSDTETLWAAADLGVLSSRQEGAPYAILEAQRAGVACVAARTAGVPELLEHGRAGLVVPAGEPGALASALIQMISNPEMRARLGAAGRSRFESHHRLERTLTRLEELLAEAIHAN